MKYKAEPITGIDGLALLFLGLKLAGQIDWSWWWVLAPVWGAVVLQTTIEVIKTVKGEE